MKNANILKAANDQALRESRMKFRALLANPSYFDNLADSSFEAVCPLKGNTFFEEIGGVDYYPQQAYLETVAYVKQPSGYTDGVCRADSLEYVRFYLSFDNGATWQDQGLFSMCAWDIAEETDSSKRLQYEVALKVDPPREFCEDDDRIRVRAIL